MSLRLSFGAIRAHNLASARSRAPGRSPVRNLWAFGRTKSQETQTSTQSRQPILSQDDLFHPLSTSPIPAMRERAARVKSLALCPVSLEKYGERRHVAFDCPDCGWPTHASIEHWKEDGERGRYCLQLREVNEDDHDLRSGRDMVEFDHFPGPQGYDETVSLANWDVFLYTRGFRSTDADRSIRHVSKILTYPITIGSVLHEFSPYTTRTRRLTKEGLRSLTALRQTLHRHTGIKPTLEQPLLPVRVIIVGARGESSLPPHLVEQLQHLFPHVSLQVYFIGPEAFIPPLPQDHSPGQKGTPVPSPSYHSTDSSQHVDAPAATSRELSSPLSRPVPLSKHETRDLTGAGRYGVPSRTQHLSSELTITTLRANYEEVHSTLEPFDPYYDVFFSFSPGFGFPTSYTPPTIEIAPNSVLDPGPPQSTTIWHAALLQILSTKCALFCTGFSPADVERDIRAIEETEGVAGEFDWLLTPGENVFRSERWEVLDADPRVMVKTNWGIWGIRGKRYDVKDK